VTVDTASLPCDQGGIVPRGRTTLLVYGGLVIVLVWGSVLRAWHLGQPSFWIDEAATALQCRAIHSLGVPRLSNGTICWDSFPATYLQSLGFFITSDPHWAVRLPSVLIGTLCILLVFSIVRLLTRHDISALTAAILTACMHEQVAWSRQARPYVFAQGFTLATVLFFLIWHQRRNLAWALVAVSMATLAPFCHRSGYIAPLILCFLMVATSRCLSWRAIGFYALLGVGLLTISMRVPGSNSSLGVTIGDLFRPPEANYSADYWRYLTGEYGWLLAACPAAVLTRCRTRAGSAAMLLLAAGCFFGVIAFRTWLFAHRYAFMLSCVIIVTFTLGVYHCACATRAPKAVVGVFVAGIAVAVVSLHPSVLLAPHVQYDLGLTAPTPPWKDAFQLVAQRHAHFPPRSGRLNIISCYPALTDVYLDGVQHTRFYVPMNYSGHPQDIRATPPYTSAQIISNVEELQRLEGYAILDDLALRMVADANIREWFATHPPNAILRAQYSIYIWILNPTQESGNAGQCAAHVQRACGRTS